MKNPLPQSFPLLLSPMISDLADNLQLFFGQASPAETRVYARLVGEHSRDVQLSGTLSGPYCEYAHTLPATVRFTDLGPGPMPLAEAIVPDPCFWTPELPYLYQASVEVRREGNEIARLEQTFGFRPLGPRGRRFFYEGKGWNLRAVKPQHAVLDVLDEFREAAAALVVENPSDELCAAASQRGVLLVADLKTSADPANDVRRLARHAAVGFVVLRGDSLPQMERRLIAPNLVLVQWMESPLQQPAAWAMAVACSAEHLEQAVDGFAALEVPLIVHRPLGADATIAQRRAACDVLQRDFAGRVELAGYMT